MQIHWSKLTMVRIWRNTFHMRQPNVQKLFQKSYKNSNFHHSLARGSDMIIQREQQLIGVIRFHQKSLLLSCGNGYKIRPSKNQ